MNKIALSIEQMEHLAKLGVDIKNASMYWALVVGDSGTLIHELTPNNKWQTLEMDGNSFDE